MKFNGTNLYEIVGRLNGGEIKPIGSTEYDNKALGRQKNIQDLIDFLIDDMYWVYACEGSEYSVETARNEARKWFRDLRTMIDENLPDLYDRNEAVSSKKNTEN